MTERQLERIVAGWRKRLRLEPWDVDVDFNRPAQTGAHASMWRAADYDMATMFVDAEEWRGWSVEAANLHVAHEMLHLLTRDLDEVMHAARGRLGSEASEVVEASYLHAVEGLVDRVSRRLVALGGLIR